MQYHFEHTSPNFELALPTPLSRGSLDTLELFDGITAMTEAN